MDEDGDSRDVGRTAGASGSLSTSADVARLAGVSLGTVSHVFSGARYVRPETRRRVEHAVAALQFQPNRVAQSLSNRRTNTVGMVVPDIANPYFSELMRGAEDVLGEKDYAVLLGSSDHDRRKERRYFNYLLGRQVDGMIMALSGAVHGDELNGLRQVGPVVLVVETVAGWEGDAIRGDDESGIEQAVRYLVELGHRRIAMIGGNSTLSSGQRRAAAFREAASRLGVRPVAVTDGAYTVESGEAQTTALLRREDRPTAICSGNDLLALGALSAARRLGLRIPSDLSVIGYDDISYAELANPRLTTVAQPAYEIGQRAAAVLLERLFGDKSEPRTVLVDAKLVVRESTSTARNLSPPSANIG
jgi:LacI family transcriptional regulator